MPTPTQSIQGGFLLVFFGVLSWIYSGIAVYGAWRVYHLVHVQNQTTEHSILSFLLRSAIAFAIGLVLLLVGFRMALRVAPYDTRDPKEPHLKF